jgi:hypothetical protein
MGQDERGKVRAELRSGDLGRSSCNNHALHGGEGPDNWGPRSIDKGRGSATAQRAGKPGPSCQVTARGERSRSMGRAEAEVERAKMLVAAQPSCHHPFLFFPFTF